MKRSDLLYVMSLGRGGVPDASVMRNSRALRRALANREHSSACAGASGDECNCSCGGSMHGGGSGDDGTLKETKVSAINVSPGGRTFVGFTDRSVQPPRNYYLPAGGEADGWKVVSADYDSEEAVLEKDGRRIAVKLGGGQRPDDGGQRPEDGEAEDGGQRTEGGEQSEDEGEGVDLGDAWEDFRESGIWSMDGSNRDGILEDIRERYELEGDAALEHGERKFLELYEKWESVQSMAGMIVEGGGGEPPPFTETQARLREVVDDPAATDEERRQAQLVYRAEMEAARRIWEAKAGQAYYTKHGRSAETEAEAREGERLAGVPYEYEGSLADGYLENRRRCRRRRRELANRAEGEALRRLANVGWTDEARAASIAARRANAAARNTVVAKAGGAGGVRGIFAPPHRGTPVDPAKHGYPMPPGHKPPATDGTLVTTGDSVMMIVNGKPVRIGSAKVLSVGQNGNLLLKTRLGSIDLGRPDKWGNINGPRGRVGGIVRAGNSVYVKSGAVLVSLEDGVVQKPPVTPLTDSRGAVIHEQPSRAGLGQEV